MPESIETELSTLPEQVDFNFHIRPILADRCFACHGPDDAAREANLRLDIQASAFGKLSSSQRAPFVSGLPHRSEVWRRITSDDPALRMPPSSSHHVLSDREKALIYRWIKEGAEWKKHWAFIAPKKSKIPEVTGRVNNPIDNFILAKLSQSELQLSPMADRERLIRRVFFDLTGLPPSLSTIDAFLDDTSDTAFDDLVDSLINTDACAERLATEWLDVARFGDTQGMHVDPERYNWPWRDWVIRAFKSNMSYDQFITWQMAGDLLPHATQDQKLATAFHRNHPTTSEGGVPDEEFRQKYVQDRTNTTATAFLGLTLECATCHDHKFDPITQEEYFQMSAFFNNVKELGMVNERLLKPGGGPVTASGPVLQLTDDSTASVLQYIESELTSIREEKRDLMESTQPKRSETPAFPEAIAHFPFESLHPLDVSDNVVHRIQNLDPIRWIVDGSRRSLACGEPQLVEGIQGQALRSAKEMDMVFLKQVGGFEIYQPYSVAAWIRTEKSGINQTIMGTGGAMGNAWRGWDFYLDTLNRLTLRLVSAYPHDYLEVRTTQVIPANDWNHVAFTYDGSARSNGISLFINGVAVKTETDYDRLTGSILRRWSDNRPEWPERPVIVFRSGRYHTGENGVFTGAIDNIYFFESNLSPLEVRKVYTQDSKFLPDQPTTTDYVRHQLICCDQNFQALADQTSMLVKNRLQITDTLPKIMVMEDMATPRPTYVLDRGQYDAKLQQVFPGTPNNILPFDSAFPSNRLGLSQWLIDPRNPLTARVAVNRYWQLIFGRGLVSTPNDFGIQGALPSHPKLLDWLSVEFMESGWDLHALLRLMVTSATYQQTSHISEKHLSIDVDNILLARAPSYRMPAEMIRDNALAASGLLVRKIGGPSVMPYQPEGIWSFGSLVSGDYKQGTGSDLYRRSMYTYIRRTSPHPFMATFDAPNRLVCSVVREETNTPLQSLILLNEPQFVECMEVLAERMHAEGGDTMRDKISYGFRLLLGRKPSSKELDLLHLQFQEALTNYQKNPDLAQKLLEVGDYEVKGPPVLLAALSIVTNTLLSFDEAYTMR